MHKPSWFTTVHNEGSLLPPDLLRHIVMAESRSIGIGETRLEGLTPTAYHLQDGRLNEAITQSWNRARGYWNRFQAIRAKLSAGDLGTTPTRERWLLPLFSELGYGRLAPSPAIELADRSYPISHRWNHVPLHLVSCLTALDKRTPSKSSMLCTSPYSLVQEVLNRGHEYLWGMTSNGLQLRLLRNNVSMTRQAYIEFDLEAMMEGEAYSDFVLFWLLCHESRFESERPAECLLEGWMHEAQQQGIRALGKLFHGVKEAIKQLGSGFLAYPSNQVLRDKLRSGNLSTHEYYRQLLRLVYRLIVLFVAEDREILFHPKAIDKAKTHYRDYYSTQHLRYLAARRKGTRHPDLFYILLLVTEKLGESNGCPELGLPTLNGFLFSAEATKDLNGCLLANVHLLDAIRALAFTMDGPRQRSVDYKNLGSEELGNVYESLLELHPTMNLQAATFELQSTSGNLRKTSGSYYTPTSLVTSLLNTTLDPVLEEACRQPNPEQALLNLKVCDPACGSGHFLIAAANRIAKRLAMVRSQEEEPEPKERQRALRDVIGSCIYGVDINPMTVELCKVSLWLEAIEPGKPLSFLDHHIQCGNSLLGATPVLLAEGIPTLAFEPKEGDNKEVCRTMKKRNRLELEREQQKGKGQLDLWDEGSQAKKDQREIETGMRHVDAMSDADFVAIHRKQTHLNIVQQSTAYQAQKMRADAWCAAFVQTKRDKEQQLITHTLYREINDAGNPNTLLESSDDRQQVRDTIADLAKQYQFFHWHLAFPDVFSVSEKGEAPENEQAGWSGGFDVVLGNPPYVFSESHVQQAKTILQTIFHLARGQYDTYWLFIEQGLQLAKCKGKLALVVPDTLLARDETKRLRELLLRGGLENIRDCGAVFKDASVSIVTFVATKGSGSGEIISETVHGTTVYEEHTYSREAFLSDSKHRFLINIPKEDTGIFNRFENECLPLQDFVKISRGEEIGKKDTLPYGSIPIIAGDNISRFCIKPPNRFVNQIKKDASLYQAQKIVIPKTGNKCIASLDDVGYVTMQSVYNLHLTKSEIGYETLLAVLNSQTIRYYIYKTFTSYKDIFPQLNQSTIQSIPINPNVKTAENNLITLVQQIRAIQQEVQSMNSLRSKDEAKMEVEKLAQEIDEIIFEVYKLTEEEITAIKSTSI